MMPIDEYTPEQANRELMELLTKAARRCAYDLRHAADMVGDTESSTMFRERATMWLGIFNPDNGLKDYRARLHNELSSAHMRIQGLLRLCRENGIDPGDYDDPPF